MLRDPQGTSSRLAKPSWCSTGPTTLPGRGQEAGALQDANYAENDRAEAQTMGSACRADYHSICGWR